MQSDPKKLKQMHQNAVMQFYGLVAVLITAVIFSLVAIASVPGLQNPETNSLPQAAWYALMLLPIGLYLSCALAFLSGSRAASKMEWVYTIVPIGGMLIAAMVIFALAATNL